MNAKEAVAKAIRDYRNLSQAERDALHAENMATLARIMKDDRLASAYEIGEGYADAALAQMPADDTVTPDERCPNCHENRMDYLANRDGIVTCGSCHRTYDLEPERREANNA